MNLSWEDNTMKPISIAIVGATGVVGRKFLEILEERKIPVKNLVLFASEKSVGIQLPFQGNMHPVVALTETNIALNPVDYALFSAGSDVALTFAPIFAKMKTLVIDNSAAWRMDKHVPLVVPEVNPEAAMNHSFIIANPNCSTIQAVVALKPLHDAYTITRMVIATYQAVSGAGSKGLHDLVEKLPTGKTTKFPYQIYENVIPHIDVFLENGNTKEEEKIIHETRKIMGIPNLPISSTAVRVPVKNSHSEVINLAFERPFQVQDVVDILKKAPGVVVYDDPSQKIYPMPLMVDGKDDVYVGRIRRDDSIKNGLNLFVVGDNIRKGAATNAIQILELFIK
jgi:aspartate-semialdehyde dehydrogenase